jgi:hypothetical protein
MGLVKEAQIYDGKEFFAYYFEVPMMHEDWHKAEQEGLAFVGYMQIGPDYWNDRMVFSKPEDEKLAKDWFVKQY